MAKTIIDKLNLRKYDKKAIMHIPDGANYFEGLTDFETNLTEGNSYDMIFAFVLDLNSLKELVNNVIEKQLLNKKGYLFAAYPKKGNKVYPTFIHRDDLLSGLGADDEGYIGNSDIKFARMVGLDDVFTVVGFKEEAGKKSVKSTKASQSVDDYIDMIPTIREDLKDSPDLLTFYQALTPGYQKDWARYVYSAKQDTTKQKRREEMKMILAQGYKTRDHYRANKK
ncbi:YdeI/OmpD-associated family protein [Bacillus sp. JJ1533]|uniref:YdeI/OmpD-associated family protein n=1 Tax=Bacillus sp. JJ1533 TaxID=3122959 RepID=UPI0030009060